VEKWGSYILVSRRDLERVDRFFARFGSITVFVSRLLPVVRTFIALPAGIARMPQGKFQLYTFIGSWPWCFGLAFAGAKLGDRWNSDPELRDLFHRFDELIIGALLVLIVWYVVRHWRHRLRTED
jgi:membrane protein DedA with SNARE-associated domain